MLTARSAVSLGKLAVRGPSAAASTTLSTAGARRALSTSRPSLASTLLFIEHKKGEINPTTLSAVTAAGKLGGDVHGVVVGTESEIEQAADKASK